MSDWHSSFSVVKEKNKTLWMLHFPKIKDCVLCSATVNECWQCDAVNECWCFYAQLISPPLPLVQRCLHAFSFNAIELPKLILGPIHIITENRSSLILATSSKIQTQATGVVLNKTGEMPNQPTGHAERRKFGRSKYAPDQSRVTRNHPRLIGVGRVGG